VPPAPPPLPEPPPPLAEPPFVELKPALPPLAEPPLVEPEPALPALPPLPEPLLLEPLLLEPLLLDAPPAPELGIAAVAAEPALPGVSLELEQLSANSPLPIANVNPARRMGVRARMSMNPFPLVVSSDRPTYAHCSEKRLIEL